MFPVGTIIPYAGDLSKIPYGWHLCDGTNGTPNLSGRFLEGTTTTPKTFKDAGLPNITGIFNVPQDNDGRSNGLSDGQGIDGGAIQKILGASRYTEDYGGWGRKLHGFRLDASLSNPLYGNSETVQPASYTIYYIMRVM